MNKLDTIERLYKLYRVIETLTEQKNFLYQMLRIQIEPNNVEILDRRMIDNIKELENIMINSIDQQELIMWYKKMQGEK